MWNDNNQAQSLMLELEQVNIGSTKQGEFSSQNWTSMIMFNVDTEDMLSLTNELNE